MYRSGNVYIMRQYFGLYSYQYKSLIFSWFAGCEEEEKMNKNSLRNLTIKIGFFFAR